MYSDFVLSGVAARPRRPIRGRAATPDWCPGSRRDPGLFEKQETDAFKTQAQRHRKPDLRAYEPKRSGGGQRPSSHSGKRMQEIWPSSVGKGTARNGYCICKVDGEKKCFFFNIEPVAEDLLVYFGSVPGCAVGS